MNTKLIRRLPNRVIMLFLFTVATMCVSCEDESATYTVIGYVSIESENETRDEFFLDTPYESLRPGALSIGPGESYEDQSFFDLDKHFPYSVMQYRIENDRRMTFMLGIPSTQTSYSFNLNELTVIESQTLSGYALRVLDTIYKKDIERFLWRKPLGDGWILGRFDAGIKDFYIIMPTVFSKNELSSS